MIKTRLSNRELKRAVKNHSCAVCGGGFYSLIQKGDTRATVLPNRELVHRTCVPKPEEPDYSRSYGLPPDHRAWAVLNRVKNALEATDYTLDAIWEAAEKHVENKRRKGQ